MDAYIFTSVKLKLFLLCFISLHPRSDLRSKTGVWKPMGGSPGQVLFVDF